MLKFSILSSCFVIVAANLCLANNTPLEQAQYRLVYLSELTEESAQELMKDPQPNDVLVCTEGTRLPLSFSLKGDLVELESTEGSSYQLVIKHPFYLRLVNDELLISLDGSKWSGWNTALTGMLCVTLSDTDNVSQLQLSAEAKFRKE